MSDTPLTFSGSPSHGGENGSGMAPTKIPQTGGDSRKLLTYWNEMRVNLDLPNRSDIDPRGIAGMLSRTFILEKIAPGLARFRVGGAHLSDLLGMDVRGMPLSAMFLPQGRQDLADKLDQVFEKPGILRAALVSPRSLRQPELNAELLVLPLRDNSGDVTRAIGCWLARGEIGRAPRRFEFRHVRVDPVTVVQAPDAAASKRPNEILGRRSTTAIEHVTAMTPKFEPLKPGQPSYLRVVASD